MATADVSKVRAKREYHQQLLLDDQSADETTSAEIEALDIEAINLIVESGAGVSGGVVELEGAPVSGYTGTWKQLGTLTINAATTVFAAAVGIDDAVLPIRYIRARISTVISGGTVDVYVAYRRG